MDASGQIDSAGVNYVVNPIFDKSSKKNSKRHWLNLCIRTACIEKYFTTSKKFFTVKFLFFTDLFLRRTATRAEKCATIWHGNCNIPIQTL